MPSSGEHASLLLHVGRSKTGTTALQMWLEESHGPVVTAGLHLPDFLLGSSHPDLAVAYSARPGRLARALAVESPADQARLRARLRSKFDEVVRPGQTWMISSEHLGSRLRSREEVGSLLGSLRQHFGQIWVVAFVRRPDYLAPSLYSEAVKAFDPRPLDAAFIRRSHRHFDQAAFISRWGGHGALLVLRPYVERYRAEPQAYFRDWFALIDRLTGVDLADARPSVRRVANTSLSAEAVEYLRQVNLRATESSISGSARRRLVQALASVPGTPMRLTPEAMIALRKRGWTSGSLEATDWSEDPLWREWFDCDAAPVALPVLLDADSRERIVEICRAQGASPEGRAWFDRIPATVAKPLRRAAIRNRRW